MGTETNELAARQFAEAARKRVEIEMWKTFNRGQATFEDNSNDLDSVVARITNKIEEELK